jgi:hypothetical protein
MPNTEAQRLRDAEIFSEKHKSVKAKNRGTKNTKIFLRKTTKKQKRTVMTQARVSDPPLQVRQIVISSE